MPLRQRLMRLFRRPRYICPSCGFLNGERCGKSCLRPRFHKGDFV